MPSTISFKNTIHSDIPETKMNIKISASTRDIGSNSVDVKTPGRRDLRLVEPIGGWVDDIDFDIDIFEEDDNQCYINNVLVSGSNTVKKQYLFLVENILSSDFGALYKIYDEYADRSYIGQMTINLKQNGETFISYVQARITFKVTKGIIVGDKWS